MVPTQHARRGGLLRSQIAVTVEGIDTFAAWAAGDAASADTVRAASTAPTRPSGILMSALRRRRSSLPLEPEDLFVLSRGLDWMIDHAGRPIKEAEVMACPPDAANRDDDGTARTGNSADRRGDRLARVKDGDAVPCRGRRDQGGRRLSALIRRDGGLLELSDTCASDRRSRALPPLRANGGERRSASPSASSTRSSRRAEAVWLESDLPAQPIHRREQACRRAPR